MGGTGSGSQPDWKPKPGRRKQAAVTVAGTGVPQKPERLSAEASSVWDMLVKATAGTAFSQDSIALESVVSLVVRQRAINEALDAKPADADLNYLSLAIGRQLLASLAKFGLSPRDRQVLLVPKEEPEPEVVPTGKGRFFKPAKGVKNAG